MDRQHDADPWALLKYAEHCRLGGHPSRTASLRARAAATCSPLTLSALETEMPPPRFTTPRRTPKPPQPRARKQRPRKPERSFTTGHAAFLKRERADHVATLARRLEVGPPT